MPQAKHSKRYRTFAEKVTVGKVLPAADAVVLLQAGPKVKFDETVELHAHFGIDPKKTDQIVRGTCVLPHGTGKQLRIAVFAGVAAQKEAKAAGASLVGGEELIEEIRSTQKVNFDVAIAEPAMMKPLAKIAKLLGQQGLMPNPRQGTVTPDVAGAIKAVASGKISFRNDAGGSVHQAVGKLSWPKEKLVENVQALLKGLKAAKPSDVKGTYFTTVVLTTTMGPAVPLDIAGV